MLIRTLCALLLFATHAGAQESLISAIRTASDNAASARFPSSLISTGFVEYNAAGEPYLMRCTGVPNKIVLYLHSWSGNRDQVTTTGDLLAVADACIVSPQFNGPNNTSAALGSTDSTARIALALSEVRYKTSLRRVYLVGYSGGAMAGLLLMGRYPDLIHRASLWVPIYDLASLYATTSDNSLKTDMVAAIGHAPSGSTDADYLARSPKSALPNMIGSPVIIINAGANDTVTPSAQAEAAVDAIEAAEPDAKVTLITWPSMGHEFKPLDALKQLVLE